MVDAEGAAIRHLIALRKLRNEVAAMLSVDEGEIRDIIGTTNLSVLKLRVKEADEALASASPAEIDASPQGTYVSQLEHGYAEFRLRLLTIALHSRERARARCGDGAWAARAEANLIADEIDALLDNPPLPKLEGSVPLVASPAEPVKQPCGVCLGTGRKNYTGHHTSSGPMETCFTCKGSGLAVTVVASPAEPREGWQLRACQAIEKAITDDYGLDGLEGETLLREVRYWPRQGACSCWLGRPGATFGSSEERESCAIHGDIVPPPPSQTPREGA